MTSGVTRISSAKHPAAPERRISSRQRWRAAFRHGRRSWRWLECSASSLRTKTITEPTANMSAFDYDVLIIGSGFGGSVAALRAAEKGYRVGVMEAGRRWNDADIPRNSWDLKDYLWLPSAELYGIQRIEFLDDVMLLCGAGV